MPFRHLPITHTHMYIYMIRLYSFLCRRCITAPQQVIAWEDKKSSHASADSAATDSVMRYGIVIMGGSAEAGEGAGEDEDAASDGRGPVRIGEGLRHVRVKLTPGRVDTLLSTQVSIVPCSRCVLLPTWC